MTTIVSQLHSQTVHRANKSVQRTVQEQSFRNFYEQELNSTLKISNHATKRLNQRNIELTSDDLEKINKKLTQAELKGARESVIFYRDLTLVASVQNRTIITALSKYDQTDGIFTNIDSALIIQD